MKYSVEIFGINIHQKNSTLIFQVYTRYLREKLHEIFGRNICGKYSPQKFHRNILHK